MDTGHTIEHSSGTDDGRKMGLSFFRVDLLPVRGAGAVQLRHSGP